MPNLEQPRPDYGENKDSVDDFEIPVYSEFKPMTEEEAAQKAAEIMSMGSSTVGSDMLAEIAAAEANQTLDIAERPPVAYDTKRSLGDVSMGSMLDVASRRRSRRE